MSDPEDGAGKGVKKMHFNSNPMRQEIFTLGLDVGVLSAYLCCCGIAAEGLLSRSRLCNVWNQGEEALEAALAILEARNIIMAFQQDGETVYQVHPPSLWVTPL